MHEFEARSLSECKNGCIYLRPQALFFGRVGRSLSYGIDSVWLAWLNHQPPRSLFSRIPPTQRSNAKIQRHFQFLPPRTSYKFEEKPAKLLKTNVIKIVLGEKITSWESLRMSISKFSGHVQSIKPLLSESFGGNCARAPRLTAVCILPLPTGAWILGRVVCLPLVLVTNLGFRHLS